MGTELGVVLGSEWVGCCDRLGELEAKALGRLLGIVLRPRVGLVLGSSDGRPLGNKLGIVVGSNVG